MFIKCSTIRAFYLITVRIYSFVLGWFTFPYVLRIWANVAVAKVNNVFASAVQPMVDGEDLLGIHALKGFSGYNLLAALIICTAKACIACSVFLPLFVNQFFIFR